MKQRPLGSTGIMVSLLGLGAGSVGDASLSERDAEFLLKGALDLGISLIDTAPSYGSSEERIGKYLREDRSRFTLSTKCGYGVPGVPDWSPECIRIGVDLALERLRTDVIDVMHFHSCPVETLVTPGVLEALEAAVQAGKVRVAAYSGENDALAWAIESDRFGVIQRSVNLCDQKAFAGAPETPGGRAIGLLAKRPLANAAWDFAFRPEREDVAVYWDRLKALGLNLEAIPPQEFALRFAAFAPGVSSCLVGTRSLTRLYELADGLSRGPLPETVIQHTRASYERVGERWPGLV